MRRRLSRRVRGLAPAAASLLLGCGVFGLVWAARAAGWLQPAELKAYDACLGLLPRDAAGSSAVVLIGVDEADAHALGHYPIYDGELADLLATLQRFKPRAIGLDVYRDMAVPGPAETDPGRARLRAALLGPDGTGRGEGPRRIVCIRNLGGDRPEDAVGPPPELENAEDAYLRVGFNDVQPDPDGVSRRVPLILESARDGGDADYSFALLLARLYLAGDGAYFDQDENDNPAHTLYFRQRPPGGAAAPALRATLRRLRPGHGGYKGNDARNFNGFQVMPDFRARDFAPFPLRAVLPGLNERSAVKAARMIREEDVRDKVVLVGITAKSLPDRALTPLGPVPGVAFHASVVGHLIGAGLRGQPPVRAWAGGAEALWVLLWCLLGAAAGLRANSLARLFVVAALGLGVVALAGAGWMAANWWVPTVPAALGWALSSFAVTAYLSRRERADRLAMHALLARHVSRDIADEIWRRRDELFERGRIPGREVLATVLFTDIKGFTALSEAVEPQALLDWLNQYMDAMAAAVHAHGGVVNKYIGDSVMAVFGVPLPRGAAQEAADAANAVRCALDMRRRLAGLNAGWGRAGLDPVCMRVGIYTGKVVAGSLGSADRLEYTVLGPVVNTASRLESYGKDAKAGGATDDPDVAGGGCRILIGESTRRLLGDRFQTKYVGAVPLKNIAAPVPVYGVVAEREGGEEPPPPPASSESAIAAAATSHP